MTPELVQFLLSQMGPQGQLPHQIQQILSRLLMRPGVVSGGTAGQAGDLAGYIQHMLSGAWDLSPQLSPNAFNAAGVMPIPIPLLQYIQQQAQGPQG